MEQDKATYIGDIFNGPLVLGPEGSQARLFSEKLTHNAFGVSEDLLRIWRCSGIAGIDEQGLGLSLFFDPPKNETFRWSSIFAHSVLFKPQAALPSFSPSSVAPPWGTWLRMHHWLYDRKGKRNRRERKTLLPAAAGFGPRTSEASPMRYHFSYHNGP